MADQPDHASVRLEPKWLHGTAVQKLISLFEHDTFRFVGGVVRNSLLGLPISDIDCATTLLPDDVLALAKAGGVKAIPTGIDHGTVTLVIAGQPFEVTTLRCDVETDGRHATVAFTESWQEDAARRDFTMNALYMDYQGQVFDYFGGLADLKNRQVRFIGSPADRIAEDRLRVLRFFRFSGHYGTGPLDVDALSAISQTSDALSNLSSERVSMEWLKILTVSDEKLVYLLESMESVGINPVSLINHQGIQAIQRAKDAETLSQPAVYRLGMLMLCTDSAADTLAENLRLSKQQARLLKAVQRAKKDLNDHKPLKETAYYHGVEAAYAAACTVGVDDQDILRWHVPIYPLNPADLLAAGIDAGPDLGKRLKRAEQQFVQSDFSLTREDLLQIALA